MWHGVLAKEDVTTAQEKRRHRRGDEGQLRHHGLSIASAEVRVAAQDAVAEMESPVSGGNRLNARVPIHPKLVALSLLSPSIRARTCKPKAWHMQD